MIETTLIAIFKYYINPLVGTIGSFFCLVSCLTLRNSAFSEKFFSHIKIEAFFMLISSIFVMLGFSDVHRPLNLTLAVNYLKSLCESLVLYNNILANVTFVLFIFNKKICFQRIPSCCKKHSAILLTLMLTVMFTVLFSYQFLMDNFSTSRNSTEIPPENTDQWLFALELTAVIIRDGVGMILVFISNIFLLIQVILTLLYFGGCILMDVYLFLVKRCPKV